MLLPGPRTLQVPPRRNRNRRGRHVMYVLFLYKICRCQCPKGSNTSVPRCHLCSCGTVTPLWVRNRIQATFSKVATGKWSAPSGWPDSYVVIWPIEPIRSPQQRSSSPYESTVETELLLGKHCRMMMNLNVHWERKLCMSNLSLKSRCVV